MMLNGKNALALLENLRLSAEALKAQPEMIPIAQEMFGAIFKNGTRKAAMRVMGAPKRHMSTARRKALSQMAKKRWAAAKKAGKNTIGAAD